VLDSQGNVVTDENGNPVYDTSSVGNALAVGGGMALAGALLIGAYLFTRR
jgi:hypothetical protein